MEEKPVNSATLVKRETNYGSLIARYGIVISFVLLFVILSVASQNFLSANNLLNVLRQVSINGVLAVGMTFVILTAGIDLSIGSILALAGAVAASLVTGADAMNPLFGVAAGLGVGALCGVVNGTVIAHFRVPAFVTTLGMLSVARGATLLYSGGRPIPNLSAEFRWLGQGLVFGIPVPVIIFAIVFAISAVVLRYSVYGRRVYAVGGNPRSAKTSGINTSGITFSVYVIMGALAGLAGVMLTARTTSALPQAGIGYELDAIAAVVIGGTSLTGGVGRIGYTLVGVLIIGMISNGLDLMGVSSYYQQIIKGSIIVLAVLIDRSRSRGE
ncbi:MULTISPECIES: ABC transporter permease [unclassified Agrobacterium]|jgi:putative xylitol transport system permease protein|uniref:ABC transporter permease n=1 Tax=unclassified Agrobacterium TaxID=2632611 RepID=UPI0024478992|nr:MULTISPECIES: ABC transporter permease [unclassified Agrobacterium]MDH0613801.1 ABC transporter permease [Agrobacterium sp. GD03872]MDH0696690.1 ABC transporter permease [Agrobacterium sp. GD03871]MDH1060146.1 ABC transporter permease [Agrobacterium sp. GD03992]MDH2210059.1 ABC transporter permease [Agrobacterium sp. GD03643]MDH2219558.1 ABC transporter permease [Agrobacterium sp. GD03638]